MKLVFLEPLGITQESLAALVQEKIGDRMEVVYYPDRREDMEELIRRSQGADVVVLSNFQYRKDVMEHCPDLKMVCVAFTGVDHVDLDACRAIWGNRKSHNEKEVTDCDAVRTTEQA